MRRILITMMLASGLLSAPALQAQDRTAGEDWADSVATAAAQDLTPSSAGAAGPGSEDVTGDAFYCHERKLGTWFYCDRRKRPAPDRAAPAAPTGSATAQLAAITQRLDELKARAVLEPTEANVTAYIRYQREQLDRASLFSDVWQRAVWQDPALDYTLQRPVSTLGKRAWLDNRKADEEATLRRLSQRYGIFYFYAQSCGACEVFAPILKAVSDKGGFDVVAVSMDGGPNRTFPRYVVDTGQYARMGLTSRATPALVLYDTVTKRPVPIGTGILSADEITERIFVLTNTKPGSGF